MRTLSFLVFVAAVAGAPVNVLTQRGDNQRTAVNSSENQLTLQNVRSHFGKLWTLFSDSKIMTQPLYASKLIVPAAPPWSDYKGGPVVNRLRDGTGRSCPPICDISCKVWVFHDQTRSTQGISNSAPRQEAQASEKATQGSEAST